MGTLRPLTLNVACPLCSAAPDTPCVDMRYTDRGRPIQQAHPVRVDSWLALRSAG